MQSPEGLEETPFPLLSPKNLFLKVARPYNQLLKLFPLYWVKSTSRLHKSPNSYKTDMKRIIFEKNWACSHFLSH